MNLLEKTHRYVIQVENAAQSLDEEWIYLMQKAQEIGLTIAEVREFINKSKSLQS
ncbi:anti-repressor SinI family protein [Bacillaceae bacterium Marseille-Q3522]|nr:anti-repressor SinI family protein [Bacillaceae bacterium Marseille-Q3522]